MAKSDGETFFDYLKKIREAEHNDKTFEQGYFTKPTRAISGDRAKELHSRINDQASTIHNISVQKKELEAENISLKTRNSLLIEKNDALIEKNKKLMIEVEKINNRFEILDL